MEQLKLFCLSKTNFVFATAVTLRSAYSLDRTSKQSLENLTSLTSECTHPIRKCDILTAFMYSFGLAIGWRWDGKEVRRFWNLCKAKGETGVR